MIQCVAASYGQVKSYFYSRHAFMLIRVALASVLVLGPLKRAEVSGLRISDFIKKSLEPYSCAKILAVSGQSLLQVFWGNVLVRICAPFSG